MCVNYHLNECKNSIHCSMCDFTINLWHLYAQNLLNDKVENRQGYCRYHSHIFLKLRTISLSLAAITVDEEFEN